MSTKIKVAIIEDELLLRKSLLYVIAQEENIEVIFDGENGQDFVTYISNKASVQPDILISDIRMPKMNGMDTLEYINAKNLDIKFIALSSFENTRFINEMINSGACSYLIKNTAPDELVHAINSVYKLGVYFNNDIMHIIVNSRNKGNDPERVKLSEREEEILKLIYEEYSTREIGECLCISERTVEGHRKKLLEKTNSKNVVGLIRWGIRNYLIPLE